MATQQITGPTFFKLRDAKDYGFWNRGGKRRLKILKGEIVRSHLREDIEYFRSRGDVLIEVTEEGTPIDELDQIGHLKPAKARSLKVYGRRSRGQPVVPPTPTPQVMQVGRAVPKVTRLEGPESGRRVPKVTRLEEPGIRTIRVADLRAPQSPTAAAAVPQVFAHAPEELSPIELASPDGSTRVIRPQVDPGK